LCSSLKNQRTAHPCFPIFVLVHRVKATDIDLINFRRLVDITPGRGINRSDNPQVYEKNIYYNEYQELNNHQKISDFLETQGILFQLLSRFTIPEVFQAKEPKVIPAKILDAMRFVYVNLHLPLKVKLLAERASPRKLSGTSRQIYINCLFNKHLLRMAHTTSNPKIHEGRNLKRFREMLAIKQDHLAFELGEDWNQQKISLLEQKEKIDSDILEQVAAILKIPAEAIRNFDEEQAINIFRILNFSGQCIRQ
jgi:hypothetical protein